MARRNPKKKKAHCAKTSEKPLEVGDAVALEVIPEMESLSVGKSDEEVERTPLPSPKRRRLSISDISMSSPDKSGLITLDENDETADVDILDSTAEPVKKRRRRRKKVAPALEDDENMEEAAEKPGKKRRRRRKKQEIMLAEDSPKKKLILDPVPEEVAMVSLAIYLKEALYSPPNNQYELDKMVTSAMTPLKERVSCDLSIIATHLSGLQPGLSVPNLAKFLLYFFIRNKCEAALEKPIVALIRLLDSNQWPGLDTAVVNAVADCLTSPEGPSASGHEAGCLVRVAACLCLLNSNRGGLLGLLAEVLGRGGPKTVQACLGAFEIWPFVLGEGLLPATLCHCMLKAGEAHDNEFTARLKYFLMSLPSYPPPPLDILIEKLQLEASSESEKSTFHALLLLARSYGPTWSIETLLLPILVPLANSNNKEAAVGAVHVMGLIGRHIQCGRNGGRLVARRTLICTLLDLLKPENSAPELVEAVATALVATVGAGRPIMLKKVLQQVPATNVGELFKKRLQAWSLANLQPLFRKRHRTTKAEIEEQTETQQDSNDLHIITEPKFPETLKELFFFDDPLNIQESDLRFDVDQ